MPRASNHQQFEAIERTWEDPETMVAVDDARRQILAAFSPLDVSEIDILDALGCVLGRDVVAAENVPPFRNSAMDGYAVHSRDTVTATDDTPAVFNVVATVAAGDSPVAQIGPGQSARIMTGAVLPDGADAVVRFEEVSEDPARPDGGGAATVRVVRQIAQWENVRHAGEDLMRGQTVLSAGTVIGPAHIGILASLNVSAVPVHRRPIIGILSTGDEVIDLGPPLEPGQIRNSNSYTIAALVAAAGGVPRLLGVARDDVRDLRERLRQAQGAVDLLITSGGVSIGDYDMVKDVLQAEGEIDVWQVRIKPGKPMAFGTIGETPLLGLPGNPAAAYVAFLQFGLPAIRKMLGHRQIRLPSLRARLLSDHENRGRRRHFVRGWLQRRGDDYVVDPVGPSGAGILTSVAECNCLIVIPEDWHVATAGSEVEVEPLPEATWV